MLAEINLSRQYPGVLSYKGRLYTVSGYDGGGDATGLGYNNPRMLQLKDFLQLVSIKYLLTFFSDLTKQAKGQVPLIFRGIVGQDLKEEMSPSFFNIEEVV